MTAKWQRWKNIMKAYPFEEKRLAKWQPPYICQPKYDGWRCRAIPTESGYLLLSSEENIFYSVPHINEALNSCGFGVELDGELYCHGMKFEQISSIVGRSINLHQDYKQIQFHIFDIVNKDPQMARVLSIDKLKGLNSYIKVSPFWLANSLDGVKSIYDKIIDLNYEGIIIRHIYSTYETKRSTYLMKFKPKKQDTYTIVGWNEEVSMSGVPKGRIGSLIMSSQTGDEFAVSAGLDGNEKARLWKIRHEIAGLSAIVHYQHMNNKKIPKGTFNVEVIKDKNDNR